MCDNYSRNQSPITTILLGFFLVWKGDLPQECEYPNEREQEVCFRKETYQLKDTEKGNECALGHEEDGDRGVFDVSHSL